MNKEERIQRINRVLKGYFSDSSNPRSIPAKELMDLFISKGIFNKNHCDGLPIRNLLRELSKKNRISEIPYVRGDMKSTNTKWFFSDMNYVNGDDTLLSGSSKITMQPSCTMTQKTKSGRANSDEYYVIGLCNEVLGLNASQQHHFDFLVGDSGRKLPVDAYYKELNLVIEYCESQHTTSIPFFDNKPTVSGVSRGEQRRMYDERRRIELLRNGINFVSIHYSDFGTTKRLKRNHDSDIEIVRKLLCDYVKAI